MFITDFSQRQVSISLCRIAIDRKFISNKTMYVF